MTKRGSAMDNMNRNPSNKEVHYWTTPVKAGVINKTICSWRTYAHMYHVTVRSVRTHTVI
jgi:hypothetical protein